MDVTKGPHHLLNVSCVTLSVQSIEGSIFSSCEIKAILSGFRDNLTVQWFLATRQQWLEPRGVFSVEYLIPSINTPESLLSLLGAAEMYRVALKKRAFKMLQSVLGTKTAQQTRVRILIFLSL